MTLPAVANRKTARSALATLLTTNLVGVGKPVEEVFAYQVATFNEDKDVAVVVVTSAGSNRSGPKSPIDEVYMAIHIFVLYSSPNDGWTEAESEDLLDDIEALTIDVLEANGNRQEEVDPEWLEMHVNDPSYPNTVIIGGKNYRHESIVVSMVVANVS